MMKNINRDIPGDDPGVVEEPKIENRGELHQFLGSVMTKTHELKRECQSLEDTTMVKTYIIESHTPPTPLTPAGYKVKIRKTNDSLLSSHSGKTMPKNPPHSTLIQQMNGSGLSTQWRKVQ